MSDNNLKKGYDAAQGPAHALYTPPEWMTSRIAASALAYEQSVAASSAAWKKDHQILHRPSRHEVLYTPAIDVSDVDVEARKAQLKRQLALLKAKGL